ncbi:MAG: hypothetical protein M3P87_10180 [Actinomycetota bacterium]|nr:hypothetical protein [Actinomycetota bacterium]
MTQRLALRSVSGAYMATAAVGTWVAVRDDLAGRPFGWDLHLSPLANFVIGLGTALSAPLGLLLALVWLNVLLGREPKTGRRAAGVIALLGIGLLVGMLAEPITWHLFDAGAVDLLPAAIIVANLVLPAVLATLALRVRGVSLL